MYYLPNSPVFLWQSPPSIQRFGSLPALATPPGLPPLPTADLLLGRSGQTHSERVGEGFLQCPSLSPSPLQIGSYIASGEDNNTYQLKNSATQDTLPYLLKISKTPNYRGFDPEVRVLERLQGKGYPVEKAFAKGMDAEGYGFLILERIGPPYKTLGHLTLNAAQQTQLYGRLAQFMQRLAEQEQITNTDIFGNNVFVNPETLDFKVIDWNDCELDQVGSWQRLVQHFQDESRRDPESLPPVYAWFVAQQKPPAGITSQAACN
jgi:Phosphotransferase enzyme family